MKLIEPQAIRLLSSTVPENDAPAWDADTAYEIGDSVIHEHRVYKAVADSTGKQPDQHSEGTDAAWRLMGPTNRYAMLDQYVSTQTVAAEDVMTFTVTFNRCTAFALLNFKATSIRAVVTGRRRPRHVRPHGEYAERRGRLLEILLPAP